MKKALGGFGSAKGLIACVESSLDRRQAQAELAIIIAAAMLMPLFCRSRVMILEVVLCPMLSAPECIVSMKPISTA